MSPGRTVTCVLCRRSDESRVTGPLSIKTEVAAHQNCLLFSSGIYCRESPEFDNLFGFTVEDVLEEVKRGSKLICSHCKKKGATAGCEIKRCKKCYHYPCAVEAEAKTVEDADNENYGLYCRQHYEQIKKKNGCVNGLVTSIAKPSTSKTPSEAGSSKVYCLACEKPEGNISLDSLSNSIKLNCEKHPSSTHNRNTNGDCAVAGPSTYSSDGSVSSNTTLGSSKRRLSFGDKQEENPSKRRLETRNGIISDDSSNSDDDQLNASIEIFAPLESDLDESGSTESQTIRKDCKSPNGSIPGNQPEVESRQEDEDETLIHSDAESESLLLPVEICAESESISTAATEDSMPTASSPTPKVILVKEDVAKTAHEVSSPDRRLMSRHTSGPSVPQQSSTARAPSPEQSERRGGTGSPPRAGSAIFPAPPETNCVTLLSSPSSVAALPSGPEHGIDSTSFWKSCNVAGCTQAIFADFINGMNDISKRIQSNQASQEDYDRALSVMAASGKLAEFVSKQQEGCILLGMAAAIKECQCYGVGVSGLELKRKLMELHKAAAAMMEVVSALRK